MALKIFSLSRLSKKKMLKLGVSLSGNCAVKKSKGLAGQLFANASAETKSQFSATDSKHSLRLDVWLMDSLSHLRRSPK